MTIVNEVVQTPYIYSRFHIFAFVLYNILILWAPNCTWMHIYIHNITIEALYSYNPSHCGLKFFELFFKEFIHTAKHLTECFLENSSFRISLQALNDSDTFPFGLVLCWGWKTTINKYLKLKIKIYTLFSNFIQ